MMYTMYMPKLGMTMERGTITRWFKQEGEWIEKDEPLLEVETDKVGLEVEAPISGRVARILAPAGTTLDVMAPIAELLPADEAAATSVASELPRESTPTSHDQGTVAPTIAATVPASAKEATIPMAIATHPTSQTQPTRIPATPAARREAHARGISLEAVAACTPPPLTRADILAFAAAQSRQASATAGVRSQPRQPGALPLLTPLAWKVATAAGLADTDLATLMATTPLPRITYERLNSYLQSRPDRTPAQHSAPASPIPKRTPQTEQPQTPAADTSELIPLTTMRRIIAERMTASFTTTPHIYLDIEVDMSEAERLRARRNQRNEPAISPTALLVKVAGICLARYPQINASFAPGPLDGQDAIRRHRGVHIGVAVAVEDGLLVPVIRDADRRDLADIAAALADLTTRARAGKLRPDDLEGGTFSISNLGMYGIDTFHAIINPPQSAILAIGRITRRPTVVPNPHPGTSPSRRADPDNVNERIEIRPILKLSLSADHRVIDGATGAQFLAALKELLEEPYLLI
jgi:pyruvate dehydrogenase E2 component (dihydrolipoamide acetyltransferase)